MHTDRSITLHFKLPIHMKRTCFPFRTLSSSTAMDSTYELDHHTHCPKDTPPPSAGLRFSDKDSNDLQVRGVNPVFNRNFRVPSSIAYTVNSIISAEYFIISLAFLLYNGGRALLTFGLICHLPGMVCLYWSLGEMMSM